MLALYIRVSSKAQNYDLQIDALTRAIPTGTVPVLYAEKLSSKTNDRPELLRLLADVRAGKLTHVYVFKLDRLCRTGVADTFKIISELRASGVVLHAVADNLVIRPNHDDIVSETLVFALSLAARLERAAINDRIAAARTRMDAAGEPWGRPPKMTPAEVETAKKMKAEGRSVSTISKALGIPRSTVGRAVVSTDLPTIR